jgi:hypothetical protein
VTAAAAERVELVAVLAGTQPASVSLMPPVASVAPVQLAIDDE